MCVLDPKRNTLKCVGETNCDNEDVTSSSRPVTTTPILSIFDHILTPATLLILLTVTVFAYETKSL